MSRPAFPERTPLADLPSSNLQPVDSSPGSPRSNSSLPSPPSSPHPHRDRDISSTPGSPSSMTSDFPLSSLSSSLFLSERSSPVLQASLDEEASSKILIIPSLTLPQTTAPAPSTSATGEAIGNVRLWVTGRRSHAACRAAAESLVLDHPLVSKIDDWVTSPDGYPILRASSIPSSSRSPHFHSHRNVEIYVAEFEDHSNVRLS